MSRYSKPHERSKHETMQKGIAKDSLEEQDIQIYKFKKGMSTISKKSHR